MGQLADDVADALRDARRTSYHRGMTETHQDLVDRIERLEAHVAGLEQWQDARFTGAAAPLLNRRLPHNDGMSVVEFRTRLAAAEQRADGLLAALNHVVPCEGAMLELHEIRARRDERVTIGGVDADWYNIFSDKPLLVAVIGPRQPPNPDLLERRGLELIEAGERLLAEYKQRQETDRKQQEVSNG